MCRDTGTRTVFVQYAMHGSKDRRRRGTPSSGRSRHIAPCSNVLNALASWSKALLELKKHEVHCLTRSVVGIQFQSHQHDSLAVQGA